LAGPVVPAARALIGSRVRSDVGGLPAELMLVEVEAYGGADDPASHAAPGRTARNGAMFGPAGTVYVYKSYGIHWMLNIATGPEGEGSAVLLRAGVPTLGADVMARRRGRADHLADGPGKLAQALGVAARHDGRSVFDGELRLLPATGAVAGQILATPRIGISKAADRSWRFVLAQLVA
jgi:DNA-3-methyladenine glycosylase